MYYTNPGCRTSIFGENRAYCIPDFWVGLVKLLFHIVFCCCYHVYSELKIINVPFVSQFCLYFSGCMSCTHTWCAQLSVKNYSIKKENRPFCLFLCSVFPPQHHLFWLLCPVHKKYKQQIYSCLQCNTLASRWYS